MGLFSGSKSTSSTTNQTTSNYAVDYNDKRAVASDQAIALTGDNNALDLSTSNLTQFFDTSNRSTNFSDFSDRSTAVDSFNTTIFTDNSRTTITDYGSVAASVGLAGTMTTKAFDTAALLSGQATGLAGLGLQGSIDNLKLQSQTGLEATKLAFDLVRSAGANNMASSSAMLGFAQNAIEKTAASFQEASDGGEKKTIMYAIGAVAIIAVAFAVSRG